MYIYVYSVYIHIVSYIYIYIYTIQHYVLNASARRYVRPPCSQSLRRKHTDNDNKTPDLLNQVGQVTKPNYLSTK